MRSRKPKKQRSGAVVSINGSGRKVFRLVHAHPHLPPGVADLFVRVVRLLDQKEWYGDQLSTDEGYNEAVATRWIDGRDLRLRMHAKQGRLGKYCEIDLQVGLGQFTVFSARYAFKECPAGDEPPEDLMAVLIRDGWEHLLP